MGTCAVRRIYATDLVLLACVAVWGLNVALTKYAFGHGFSPLSFAAPQFAIATLMFVAFSLRRFGSLRLDRRDVLRLALWGGLVFSTNWIAFSWSVEFASAATVALLIGTMPLFAALFSQLLGIERLDRRRWLGGLVSFTGVGLVAVGATTGLQASVGGVLLALYVPASFALYSIGLAPIVRRHGSLRVNTLATLFCLPVLLAASAPEARADRLGRRERPRMAALPSPPWSSRPRTSCGSPGSGRSEPPEPPSTSTCNRSSVPSARCCCSPSRSSLSNGQAA